MLTLKEIPVPKLTIPLLKGITVSAPGFLYPGFPSAVSPNEYPPKLLFSHISLLKQKEEQK